MSRPRPGGAEANRATLKSLVKLESNKTCADCKRNKHPRWASWNIGVFICIRCSGIHRGMGTHISRVKSVDLDTWTDEQTQSMVKWGNARANKYWENGLAEGHVPNESKIENFIRTKYESKRWCMEGGVPNPSTLGDGGDEDIPLGVVQENLKAKMGSPSSSSHGRNGSVGMQPPPRASAAAAVRQQPQPQPQIDLFGDDGPTPVAAPARPSTTQPVAPVGRTASAAAPAKQSRTNESLLGMDFFGTTQSAPPARAASTGPTGATGRSDLKQSILSLYAAKPVAAPAQPQANVFGGMQSPPVASPAAGSSAALSDLGDVFGSLSFSPSAQQQAPQAQQRTPFSNFSPPASATSKPTAASALSGGSFFDTKPVPPPKSTTTTSPPRQQRQPASSAFDADFGDFSSAASPSLPTSTANFTQQAAAVRPSQSNGMSDLFDISPAPPPKPAASTPTYASNTTSNAFNLSQPAAPKPAPVVSSGLNNMDAWGSSNAWATADAAPAPKATAAPTTPSFSTSSAAAKPAASASTAGMFDSGWGNETAVPAPTRTTSFGGNGSGGGGFAVQQDEEFGGWSHASPVATTPGAPPKASGGGQDDLFGNVWG